MNTHTHTYLCGKKTATALHLICSLRCQLAQVEVQDVELQTTGGLAAALQELRREQLQEPGNSAEQRRSTHLTETQGPSSVREALGRYLPSQLVFFSIWKVCLNMKRTSCQRNKSIGSQRRTGNLRAEPRTLLFTWKNLSILSLSMPVHSLLKVCRKLCTYSSSAGNRRSRSPSSSSSSVF